MRAKIDLYNFNLTKDQEERAKKIHDESIIIDMLFQGPLSPYSLTKEIEEKTRKDVLAITNDPFKQIDLSQQLLLRYAIEGKLPAFKECWYDSGITAGSRQAGTTSVEDIVFTQMQFDTFDWLIKALTVEDIRKAKREGKKAGIVQSQSPDGLEDNIDGLDAIYDFGMRVLQLTYNLQNRIGSGSYEKSGSGITQFGQKFIERMNKLGMVVDLGHCGKQTTLDACDISSAPVIASHTSAEGVYFHKRAKSDEELIKIAKTGGVIGVFAMPTFMDRLDNRFNVTIEKVLDNIDYIVSLVGVNHVGIGTDWPMSEPFWSIETMKNEVAPKLGFVKEEGPDREYIIGLKEYRQFINITRGLILRGYSDMDTKKILGENWMRVFKQVWK
ncbi:membrane dipeptidase [Clostridiaceae bacterium M8S5]|nr:membrane dipeptidase [Clostridiaceae bacterium M8S5]